jgi:hypothetical protein
MTPLSLRAGLLLLAAMWSSPLLADAVLSLGAGDRTLDIGAHRHGHDLPSRDDDGPGRGDAGALARAGHM